MLRGLYLVVAAANEAGLNEDDAEPSGLGIILRCVCVVNCLFTPAYLDVLCSASTPPSLGNNGRGVGNNGRCRRGEGQVRYNRDVLLNSPRRYLLDNRQRCEAPISSTGM